MLKQSEMQLFCIVSEMVNKLTSITKLFFKFIYRLLFTGMTKALSISSRTICTGNIILWTNLPCPKTSLIGVCQTTLMEQSNGNMELDAHTSSKAMIITDSMTITLPLTILTLYFQDHQITGGLAAQMIPRTYH